MRGTTVLEELSPFASFLREKNRLDQIKENTAVFIEYSNQGKSGMYSKVSRFFNELKSEDYAPLNPFGACLVEMKEKMALALAEADIKGKLNTSEDARNVVMATDLKVWIDFAMAQAIEDLFDEQGDIKKEMMTILRDAGVTSEMIDKNSREFKLQLFSGYVVNLILTDERVRNVILARTDGVPDNPYADLSMVFSEAVTGALNRISSNEKTVLDKKFIDELHGRLNQHIVQEMAPELQEGVVKLLARARLRQSVPLNSQYLVEQIYHAINDYDVGNHFVMENAQALQGSTITYPCNYLFKAENAHWLDGVEIGQQAKTCEPPCPVREIGPRFLAELFPENAPQSSVKNEWLQRLSKAEQLYVGGIIWSVKNNFKNLLKLHKTYLQSELNHYDGLRMSAKKRSDVAGVEENVKVLQVLQSEMDRLASFEEEVEEGVYKTLNLAEIDKALRFPSDTYLANYIEELTRLELFETTSAIQSEYKSLFIEAVKGIKEFGVPGDTEYQAAIYKCRKSIAELSALKLKDEALTRPAVAQLPQPEDKGKGEAKTVYVLRQQRTIRDVLPIPDLMNRIALSLMNAQYNEVVIVLRELADGVRALRESDVLGENKITGIVSLQAIIKDHYPELPQWFKNSFSGEFSEKIIKNREILADALGTITEQSANRDDRLAVTELGELSQMLVLFSSATNSNSIDNAGQFMSVYDFETDVVPVAGEIEYFYLSNRLQAETETLGNIRFKIAAKSISDEITNIRAHSNDGVPVGELNKVMRTVCGMIEQPKNKILAHAYLEMATELKKQRGFETLGKIMLAPYKVEALDSACSDYRAHLEDEFYGYLLKSYPEKSVELNEKRNQKPDIYARDTMLTKSDDIGRLQGNDGFKLLIRKYKCLNEMQAQLNGAESPLVNLANFREKFETHRHVLNESRSTDVANFFKAVATVLTAGLAAVFGIWRVEGREKSKEFDELTKDVKPRNK